VKPPAPARLAPHHEAALVATLLEIGLKTAAACSALRGGRVSDAAVWIGDVRQAADRLGPALERAMPTERLA
jgi:hypothetical protein